MKERDRHFQDQTTRRFRRIYNEGFETDTTTDAAITIDYPHYEVHAGNHYMFTDSVELGSGASQYYMITVSSLVVPHMTFHLDGSAITQWQFYEDTDKTGVSAQTAANNDRNSTNTAATTLYKGVSGGTTDGTLAYLYKGGSGTQQSRSETDAGNNEELILKADTSYVLKVKSFTAANLTNIKLEWYEIDVI